MENDCELLPIMLNRKTDRKRNSFIVAFISEHLVSLTKLSGLMLASRMKQII